MWHTQNTYLIYTTGKLHTLGIAKIQMLYLTLLHITNILQACICICICMHVYVHTLLNIYQLIAICE